MKKMMTFAIACFAVSALQAAPTTSPTAAPAAAAPASKPANPACSQLHDLNEKEKTDMQGLEAQIKPLRQQFDGQIKPLEEKRKTLADQYRDQRLALMNQIVPGSGDALKAYDEQLKTVHEQEEADLKKVREQYAATRQGIKRPNADLHCGK